MTLFVVALSIAMILTIWFKTEAFTEYAELLGITRLSFFKNFRTIKKTDSTTKLLDYLTSFHDSFLTRLVTCPICSSTWLGIASGAILGWKLILPVAFLGLCFYSLLSMLLKHG